MKTLHNILLLLLFAAGLLLGIQIPNFIDQYQKRIDAHYIEANENLSGFQKIADMFFNGSIEELIKKHESSTDEVFRSEAAPIRKILERKLHFERELQALQTSLYGKIKHLTLAADREIIDETYNNYSTTLPLNTDAIVCGLSAGLIVALIFEGFILFFKSLFKSGRRAHKPA